MIVLWPTVAFTSPSWQDNLEPNLPKYASVPRYPSPQRSLLQSMAPAELFVKMSDMFAKLCLSVKQITLEKINVVEVTG